MPSTDKSSMNLLKIHGLRLDNIKGDIYGGVTAAVVALPLAMAFGVASGVGPIAGLYGAIFIGFFAALFGGTPSQVSGPTGPMTVVMAGIFTAYISQYPETGQAIAFTVVIMGGLFQAMLGLFKVGRYINLVPQPVISGFMSGIGVIIILLQLGPLFGHAAVGNPLEALSGLGDVIADINMNALALGLFTLAIVYFLPTKVSRIIPAPLLALVLGTVGSVYFIADGAVSILGEIPTGLPSLVMPIINLEILPGMVKYALMLALLGSIDSLLTSLVADSVTRTHHDSNRELVGQGIGNMVAGVFGGLPGAGATMRTVVNVRAGGRTPISGMLHAVALLTVLIGAGGLASHIPHVVLAGILIKVGTDIIDWRYIKKLHLAPRTGVVLMLTVLTITVFVDLITSVAVGMIAASLILVNRMAKIQMSNTRTITSADDDSPLCEEAMSILEAAAGRILVYQLSGPLNFGAAKAMAQKLSAQEGYDVLVLDLSEVSTLDYTTSVAIEDMIRATREDKREVIITGLTQPVRDKLERVGVLDLLGSEYDFPRRLYALQMAASMVGINDPNMLGEYSKSQKSQESESSDSQS